MTNADLLGEAEIGLMQVHLFCAYVYVLKQQGDPDGEAFLDKLERFLGDRPPSGFEIMETLLGGAAIRMMRNDREGALEWLDAAIERKHAFLHLTNEPVFAPLTDYDAFPARLARMEENAEHHRAVIEDQMASN